MKHRTDLTSLTLVLLSALVLIGFGQPDARAQQPNRVGLVIRHGNDTTITRCVEFNGSEISGYDLLMRSGLDIVADFGSGMGAAICSIEGEGCPVNECLTCATPDYWSYWRLKDGTWNYYQAGASTSTVRDGDVEGWRWGSGDPPPVIPFDQICAPPPTDTPPPPTDTPVPPTATSPPPTDTPVPAPEPMIWFRLDDNPVAAGACTAIRWDTSNVQDVYLDGERVDRNGSRQVCPSASQEYRLRIVSAAGERTETLVLGVTGAAPPPTATSQPAALASPSSSSLSQPAAAAASQPSPTPQPGTASTPSPSPSPTALLSNAVLPSSSPTSTPMRVALAVPSPTPASRPAGTSSRSSSSAQPTPGNQSSSSTQLGYITFNFIMIGLLSWLLVRMLRRG